MKKQYSEKKQIRIEVPEVISTKHTNQVALPGFVKFYSPDALFSLTPVNEEYARRMAAELAALPISGYDSDKVLKQMANQMVEKLTIKEIRRITAIQSAEVEEEMNNDFDF